jgi:hypothetical protein
VKKRVECGVIASGPCLSRVTIGNTPFCGSKSFQAARCTRDKQCEWRFSPDSACTLCAGQTFCLGRRAEL